MKMKRITIGIDRSEVADNALSWCLAFAATTGAEVEAVATWQMPLICQLPGTVQGLPTPEFMSDQATAALREIVARIGHETTSEVPISQKVAEGKPGPALVEIAADSDLLVVGRTGYGKRRGFARFAELTLGSTARHCVHHSTVPVVTVPKTSTWGPTPTVVVGVDGSPASVHALDWALAELPAGASVHVIRAFEPWVGDGLVPQDLIGEEELHREMTDETQAWIDAAVTRHEAHRTAPVIETVIATAQHALLNPSYTPDLIVVGERSRTGVASMILGSVSDYVVRYAECPVVVVPEPE